MRKILATALGVALALTATVALAGRNSSGTMSFTSVAGGYPFQSGQTISSAGVNSNFSELATELSDSLSRSGKGGMSAPLRCADGTAAAPAFSWTSDTNTGFYRIGADNVGLALGGSKYVDFSTSGLAVTGWAAFSSTVTGAGYSGGPISGTTGTFSGSVVLTGASGANISKTVSGNLSVGTEVASALVLRTEATDRWYVGASSEGGALVSTGAQRLIKNVAQPVDDNDAATKIWVTGSAIAVHNAVTDAHSATASATASRIVLRDASGRASVADPSASTDIATKAYVDALFSTTTVTAGSDWTVSPGSGSVAKSGNIVSLHLVATVGSSGAWTSIATVPSGYRPALGVLSACHVNDSTPGTQYTGFARVDTTGVVSLDYYDNGTSLATPFTIGASDSVHCSISYPVP